MKEIKKMIGKTNSATAGYKADRFCGIANQEVIPLLKHFEIQLDEQTIRRVVADRKVALALVVDRPLQSEEYAHQPELLKKAVADILVKKFEEAAAEYGNDTATEDAQFATFDPSTCTMCVDQEKIDQTREIWISGEENCAIWADYCAAAEMLNKLFGGRVPGHRLAHLFNLNTLRDGAALPNLSMAPNFTEFKERRGKK